MRLPRHASVRDIDRGTIRLLAAGFAINRSDSPAFPVVGSLVPDSLPHCHLYACAKVQQSVTSDIVSLLVHTIWWMVDSLRFQFRHGMVFTIIV